MFFPCYHLDKRKICNILYVTRVKYRGQIKLIEEIKTITSTMALLTTKKSVHAIWTSIFLVVYSKILFIYFIY